MIAYMLALGNEGVDVKEVAKNATEGENVEATAVQHLLQPDKPPGRTRGADSV